MLKRCRGNVQKHCPGKYAEIKNNKRCQRNAVTLNITGEGMKTKTHTEGIGRRPERIKAIKSKCLINRCFSSSEYYDHLQ